MLSIILADSIKHKFVTIPRSRFSRRIHKSIKTVDRGSRQLQDSGLLKVKSGQYTHEYNIYIPNPILFEFAFDFKDQLFSLKQYIYEASNSFLVENVSPYIDNIRNRFFSFSSSSKRSFKTSSEPTVSPEISSLEKNLLTSVWITTEFWETVTCYRPLTKIFKNKRVNNENTNNYDDAVLEEMYRHIQFDSLGTIETIDIK
jgi:hypothetical protein